MREGSSDISLQTLIERHGQSRDFELKLVQALSEPFRGPLADVFVKIRTKKNFSSGDVDLAFYFADNDKGDINKYQYLGSAIRSIDNGAYVERTIIGVPDPHMEAWLLTDEDCVKVVFGLTGHEPIPFPE